MYQSVSIMHKQLYIQWNGCQYSYIPVRWVDVCHRGDCLRVACGMVVEGREYSAWGVFGMCVVYM